MLELPFHVVDKRIKIMLKYGTKKEVAGSLQYLTRATCTIKSRLALAKELNISMTGALYNSEQNWQL